MFTYPLGRLPYCALTVNDELWPPSSIYIYILIDIYTTLYIVNVIPNPCNCKSINSIAWSILYIAETYKVQSGTKLFMDVAKNEN